MDTVLKRSTVENKIISAITSFKKLNLEKILSNMLENMPNENLVNYVGELNRNDIMH